MEFCFLHVYTITHCNDQSVFRFTDTDLKRISKNLKPHEEGLTKVLRETMPGLVQSNTSDNLRDSLASPTTTTTTGPGTSTSNLTLPTDERMLTGMDQHHRLLIKPDTFNVTVLFQPTLAFLDRVVDVLPSGIDSAKASSGVLDDFVLKVYLPQLEEKVLDLFHTAVAGLLRTSVFSVIR
jgi:exocyst complex component 4